MTKWICRVWFFIENVEIMKKCGKEMIKGASRLYINDFIRLSHLSISADLHNLLVLPPKMYRWLSQKRPKYISIIRVSLACYSTFIKIRATGDDIVVSSSSGWALNNCSNVIFAWAHGSTWVFLKNSLKGQVGLKSLAAYLTSIGLKWFLQ